MEQMHESESEMSIDSARYDEMSQWRYGREIKLNNEERSDCKAISREILLSVNALTIPKRGNALFNVLHIMVNRYFRIHGSLPIEKTTQEKLIEFSKDDPEMQQNWGLHDYHIKLYKKNPKESKPVDANEVMSETVMFVQSIQNCVDAILRANADAVRFRNFLLFFIPQIYDERYNFDETTVVSILICLKNYRASSIQPTTITIDCVHSILSSLHHRLAALEARRQ
jgi:hypothetical protein